MNIDRRLSDEPIEIRSSGERERMVTGYASVFNRKSNDLGGWFEVIMPGAFKDALASGREVRALFNHDSNMVLGSTRSGTVRLSEDKKGLRYEIDLPDTTYANNLAKLIERGDIRGNSFAFLPTEPPTWKGDTRYIARADLYDVSIVTSPAYEDAQVVSMRAQQDWQKQRQTTETYKRKAVLLNWT